MTGIPADQLPAEARRRLGLPARGRQRPAPSRAGTSTGKPCPGHCACGQPFRSARAWEKHAAETDCTRWNLDLDTLAAGT